VAYQAVQAIPVAVPYAAYSPAPRRGPSWCLIICFVIMLVILGISLAIYFGAVFCRPGKVVQGTCPAVTTMNSFFLAQPREFDHGSSCSRDSSHPGSCCDWRSATCCTKEGCDSKYEYAGSSRNLNCSRLLGLLSCAVCSTTAGAYVGDQGKLYMCPSFCNEIWNACKSPESDPRTYCNGLYNIEVRDSLCYSGAWIFRPQLSTLIFLFVASASTVRQRVQ
jgi:hypothetical protein